MMKAPRILIVFPHNYSVPRSGIHRRYRELINYFTARNFRIDLLAIRNFVDPWPEKDYSRHFPELDNLFLYNHSAGLKRSMLSLGGWMRWLRHTGFLGLKVKALPDYVFPGLKKMFVKITGGHDYDYILISYVYWASLVYCLRDQSAITVLTMEDLIAENMHHAASGRCDHQAILRQETEKVNLFDRVIGISHSELMYISSKARHPEYYFVPVFMKPDFLPTERATEFDLLFVGSDNPNNRRAALWFLDNVFQRLAPKITCLFVGAFVKDLPDLPGLTKIPFLPDIHDAFRKCRIFVNPMQDGTGMKVKLIEALSAGMPVINTIPGTVGLEKTVVAKLIVCKDHNELALQIDRLVENDQYYQQQCLISRKVFLENFTAEIAYSKLDSLFFHK